MYFTKEELEATAPEIAPTSDIEIKQASRQIDVYLPYKKVIGDTRVDVDDLSTYAKDQFELALIEHIKFLREQGPSFFTREEYKSVSTKDFSTTGKLPKINSMTKAHLRRAGLLGKHLLGKVPGPKAPSTAKVVWSI